MNAPHGNMTFHLRRQATEALSLVTSRTGKLGGLDRDARNPAILRAKTEHLARNLLVACDLLDAGVASLDRLEEAAGRGAVVVTDRLTDQELRERILCTICGRPRANDADWERYNEGEGAHLCWDSADADCVPRDWPATVRALRDDLDALTAAVHLAGHSKSRRGSNCEICAVLARLEGQKP